ncbi:MAG: thioredoxin family protein [Casimicrobiaceae bacterium]
MNISPIWYRSTVALLVLVFAVATGAQSLPAKFDPARDAAADLATAVAQAKAQGKHVLVDVGGEWCSWCHILDRFIGANADVRTLRDHGYVWVQVNWSKENRNEALLSRWPKIVGYPHLFVLDGDGRLLHSQDTGALESGKDYERAKFIAFLKAWAPQGKGA